MFVTVRGSSVEISRPWRYLYEDVSLEWDPDVVLDHLGIHGWELVTVEETRRDQGADGSTVFGSLTVRRYGLKRPDADSDRARALELMSQWAEERTSLGQRSVACPQCSKPVKVAGNGYVGCSTCGEYFEV